MLSESFKHDLNQFINSKHTAADFMVFLKHHPEARNILRSKTGNYHDLEFMSEEEIHNKFDSLSNNLDPTDNLDYDFDLACLIDAVDEDREILSASENYVREFSAILGFNSGIPVVCNIMIGNEIESWWLNAVQDKATGDHTLDHALSEHDAFIECDLDCDETVKEIEIRTLFEYWKYEDIKALYAYVSKHFNYENRQASYSFDDDNDFSDVQIQLSNSLFEIQIKRLSHYIVDYLQIRIVRQKEDPKVYQALNTFLTSDEIDDLVLSTLKAIIQQITIKRCQND